MASQREDYNELNFISLYQKMQGRSEVPPEYHFWACIALLSAVLADRVYVRKGRGKVVPNLFVFLIGPSGLGKGVAIDGAMELGARVLPSRQIYNGRLTAQRLIDTIGTTEYEPLDADKAKMWFISPELSMSLGSGERADDFIKVMTELYSSTLRPVPVQEGTRTRGLRNIHMPCLTWLSGTTIDWLNDCITPEAVQGGFFARVITIMGRYDFSKENRFWNPEPPAEHKAMYRHVVKRLRAYRRLKGRVRISKKAVAYGKDWYLNKRVEPAYEIIPWWKRQQDTALKLATIFAVSDIKLGSQCEHVLIKEKHMRLAIRIVQELEKQMPEAIRYASAGVESRGITVVYDALQRNKQMTRTELIRAVSPRGITGDKLDSILDTLIESQYVKEFSDGKTRIYLWVKARPAQGDPTGREAPE